MLNVFIYRGKLIESAHRVIAVVSEPNGNFIEAYGDTSTIIYPRSSIKPIQSLSLVLTGAIETYGLTSKEIAIASASHGGEPFHVECVDSWLKKLNLSSSDLECGAHLPSYFESAVELIKLGKKSSPLHNNCSGKHVGMLCLAKLLNVSTKGYSGVNHEVQQHIKRSIEELIDYSIPVDSFGIDGCSIPTWAIPLGKFAFGLARFADSEFSNLKIASACKTIFESCVENPEYLAGTGRFCTDIMRECSNPALVKSGAEGVIAAIIKSPKPLGIVVKSIDGTARASEAVLAFLLNKYKILPDSSKFLRKKIYNWNNIETGFIEVSEKKMPFN